MDFRKEVKAGADFLIENGYRLEDINLDSLNLQDCFFCVMGQLFGEYWKAVNTLDISIAMAISLGFNIYSDEDAREATDEAYAQLTEQWKTEIKSRIEKN